MGISPVAASKTKLGCEERGWQKSETVGKASQEEEVRRGERECRKRLQQTRAKGGRVATSSVLTRDSGVPVCMCECAHAYRL